MSESSSILNKLNAVLCLISKSISENQRQDILMYINANERGLAIETLCDLLYEDELSISVTAYDLLKETGNTLHLESETWEMLKPQVAKEGD